MRLALCRGVLALSLVSVFTGTAHAARFLISGADAGGGPHVVIRIDKDQNGTFETIADSFYAFAPAKPDAPLFAGGVRVATGDFDGDGNDELVTAMGPGGPWVRIWRMTGGGQVGELLEQFAPYGGFVGGIFVSTGDFNGDGKDELVTSPDYGGNPRVIVWHDLDNDGRVSDDVPLANLLVYNSFTGGVRTAAGDVDGTIGDELITAPGPGGGPHIRVLKLTGGTFVSFDEFFAYAPSFTGGVYVAAGPISAAGSSSAEIITAPGASGGPHVRIFTDSNGNGLVSDNPTFDEFLAYTPSFTGGVRLAAGDTDASGTFVEVVTVPGPGGGSDVRILDDTDDPGVLLSDNAVDDEFFAYDPSWLGGSFVAVGRYTQSAYARAGSPVAIPDSGTINQVMCIPSGAGIVRDLDIGLGISHSFDGDLDVTLTHLSTGTSVALFTDIGGTDEGFIIRLNDEAGADISTANNPADGPITGSFNPEGTAVLSVFDGQDASGCWQLTITDDNGADTGSLFDWVMYFTF